MGTLRITEAELARNVHAVLARVQEGVEVIVDGDRRWGQPMVSRWADGVKDLGRWDLGRWGQRPRFLTYP